MFKSAEVLTTGKARQPFAFSWNTEIHYLSKGLVSNFPPCGNGYFWKSHFPQLFALPKSSTSGKSSFQWFGAPRSNYKTWNHQPFTFPHLAGTLSWFSGKWFCHCSSERNLEIITFKFKNLHDSPWFSQKGSWFISLFYYILFVLQRCSWFPENATF